VRPESRIAAHRVFFPLAALYAAAALPLSIAAMTGALPAIPGLATPARHAHEMLFGFGLAAVAGNQMGPLPRTTLGALVATWLLARLAFLAAPGSVPAIVASAAFAGMLAWQLLPRVTARVRKWRNRTLPAAILALCGVAVMAQASAAMGGTAAAGERMLLGGIVLVALVMFFMSGRIIAPTAAGHLYAGGIDMAARVQPRIEGAVMAAGIATFVLVLIDRPQWAGATFLFAACAAALRLARWRPWRVRARRDIVCLVIGYAWLVAGMGWVGACLIADKPVVTALHLVTVGAMGTLTVNVMALTWARLARADPARLVLPSLATALVLLATVMRVAADSGTPHRGGWLLAAAFSWSAAYVLLLACFARISLARSASRVASAASDREGRET
jgi:uncharacterized protein involved in response to NO